MIKGMKILYAGFKGKNNSSKLLLDALNCDSGDKLYLTNSYQASVHELVSRIQDNSYERVLIFGQWGSVKAGAVRVETLAKKGRYRRLATISYRTLTQRLERAGLTVQISEYAGNWLCSNVYYYGLKCVEEGRLDCQMVFIHLPKAKQVSDFERLARQVEASVD